MKELNQLNIAIDWFAWTWKWTIAKAVAKKLWLKYLDTWAMYRAFTYFCLKNWINPNNIQKIDKQLKNIKIEYIYDSNNWKEKVILNWQDITNQIRNIEISKNTAIFSNIPEIRKFMVNLQQEYWKKWWIIMDWRDIWSVVLPNADIKIYLQCDLKIRAQRRLEQLKKTNNKTELKKIMQSLEERDKLDNYKIKLLFEKYWNEIVVIDNSNLTIEEQVQIIYKIAQKIIN